MIKTVEKGIRAGGFETRPYKAGFSPLSNSLPQGARGLIFK